MRFARETPPTAFQISALTAMLPEVEKLVRVQHHDQKIKSIDKELSGIPVEELDIKEKLVEDQRKAFEIAREKLKETEVSVKEELEDLSELAAKLKADRAVEVDARQKQVEPIEEHVIDNYNRLFKSKNGMAVVGLVDEVCQGCHMKVVKSTVVEVKGENRLAHCENCGRILYWWTDDSVGKNRGEY